MESRQVRRRKAITSFKGELPTHAEVARQKMQEKKQAKNDEFSKKRREMRELERNPKMTRVTCRVCNGKGYTDKRGETGCKICLGLGMVRPEEIQERTVDAMNGDVEAHFELGKQDD